MINYYGDFAEDDTVNIPFNTFSSDDPSKSCTITELADADIKVYKDGSTDEIVTDGASIVINFDGHTGAHMITIDTSADAAYTTGSEYAVLIDGTVIDGATDMDMWVGTFSIENRYNPVTDYDGPTNAEMVAAFTEIKGATWAAGTDTLEHIRNKQTDIEADTAAILIDTDTMEADLKTEIDANETKIDTMQGNVTDILTDTGTTLDTLIKDIPTNAEFALRTLLAADYVVTTDTIAGVTAVTNDVGITQAGADKVWGTAARVLTANTNLANLEVDLTKIHGSALTETVAGYLAAAFVKLFDVATPLLVASDVMRGTDGANTTVPDAAGTAPTAVEIQAEMEENGASILDTLRDDLADGGRLDLLIDAIKAQTDLVTAARMGALTDWIDGGRLDLLLDAIKAVTDALTAAAATKLALSAGTIVAGTVSHDNTAASTTVFYSDDITEATADHFNGRIVIFTSGALQYQATDITDYALDTGEGKFTVTALTEAPADNVTFIIV